MKIYRFAGDDEVARLFTNDRYILLKQENALTTLLLFSPDDDDDGGPVPLPPGQGLFIQVHNIPTPTFETQYKEDHEWPQSSQS